MKRLTLLVAMLAGLSAQPVLAQDLQLIESYYAWLSDADHHNSKGTRLTEYWQVIRQDRANFHRFGLRDDYDDPDAMFDDAQARATLEALLRQDPMPKDQADLIVQGEVLVGVEIYGFGSTPKSALVELLPLGE